MASSVLLVDGHNYLFRAFGIPFQFFNDVGVPLHVATVYLSLLRRAFTYANGIDKVDKMHVIFDAQILTPNHDLDPNYKANRPTDYSTQADSPFHHLPLIKSCLDYLHIHHFETTDYEADDYIASLAKAYQSDHQVFIASSDSDFYQLVNDKVKMINLKRKGQVDLIDNQNIITSLNITPSQYVQYKALVGDKADNIAGVPGIGVMRAAKILNGEMEFDWDEWSDLLERNERLIRLEVELSVLELIEADRLRDGWQKVSNHEIFANTVGQILPN